MNYIYVDESGDLGFDFNKKHTSNYFVVAFLITSKPSWLEKILKKLFSELKQTGKSGPGHFHAHEESTKIKKKILTSISTKEVEIKYFYLAKKVVSEIKAESGIKIYSELICKGIKEIFKMIPETLNLFYRNERQIKPKLNY